MYKQLFLTIDKLLWICQLINALGSSPAKKTGRRRKDSETQIPQQVSKNTVLEQEVQILMQEFIARYSNLISKYQKSIEQ